MTRIRFDFGAVSLDADLKDTPTALAVEEIVPFVSTVLTWGEEVYFDVPLQVRPEVDARIVVTPGEIAFWPDGPAIAIGYGATPASREGETRLANPCNVFAVAVQPVQVLRAVWAGTRVSVHKVG
jgi:hypothetical protein